MDKINITATNEEDFKTIKEALETLPEKVLNQITDAKQGVVGIECTLRVVYGEGTNIFLPASTRQIVSFEDYIGVYTEGFFFTVQRDFLDKYRRGFVILDK